MRLIKLLCRHTFQLVIRKDLQGGSFYCCSKCGKVKEWENVKFIKRLFCNHDFSFLRKTSGDENNYSLNTGGRNIYRCTHCGKIEYRHK